MTFSFETLGLPAYMAFVGLTVLGASHYYREVSTEELAAAFARSPCLKQAVLDNKRSGTPLRPWTADEVSGVERTCARAERLRQQLSVAAPNPHPTEGKGR